MNTLYVVMFFIMSVLCSELHSGEKVEIAVTSTGCKDQEAEVAFLEHVEVIVDMTYTRRGDLEIILVSPQGALCHSAKTN